jgi:hypothetical protein
MALQPQWASALLFSRLHDHTPTQHTRWDSSEGVIGTSPKPVLTTHKILKAGINSLGGIRSRNPSKQAAADPHLRLRDHWCRRTEYCIYNSCTTPADSVRCLGVLIVLKVHFHHNVYHVCCQSIKKLGSVHNFFF